MKRFIGILIAVAILASCMATAVFAAAGTISVQTKTIKVEEAGNEVTLSVKNAEEITSYTMALSYDASQLELVSVKNGGVAGSSFNAYGDNVVGWAAANEAFPAGSTLFVATFKIKVEAKAGDYFKVGLTMDSNGGIYDANRDEVTFAPVAGGIKIEAPAHEHKYTTVVEEFKATCEEAGYEIRKCECGETKKFDTDTALGHIHGKPYHHNKDHHWFECTRKVGEGVCGVKSKLEEHVYDLPDSSNPYIKYCVCGRSINTYVPDVPVVPAGDMTTTVAFGTMAMIFVAAAAAYVASRKFAK